MPGVAISNCFSASDFKRFTDLNTAMFRHEGIQGHHDSACQYAADTPIRDWILAKFISKNLATTYRATKDTLEFKDWFGIILASGTTFGSTPMSKPSFAFKKSSSPSQIGKGWMNGSSWNLRLDNTSSCSPLPFKIGSYPQSVPTEQSIESVSGTSGRDCKLIDGLSIKVSIMKVLNVLRNIFVHMSIVCEPLRDGNITGLRSN